MKEIIGDMWQEHAEGAVVAITTNGAVNKVGKAIMMRGCARQAGSLPGLIANPGCTDSPTWQSCF